ncbi:hypothetical protein [Kiloniella laminariae]|uniref:hypothetical protein n=1 Tax=Kiloniella laminariae TaxID=454162 RepID=UPI00036CFC06|nr:hypothetical protein [Kiloniella laminariae]
MIKQERNRTVSNLNKTVPDTTEDLWNRYAASWTSAPDIRDKELAFCLSEGASYCDPVSEELNAMELSSYMSRFQEAFPGHRFRINKVQEHHNKSLAQWEMLDQAGRAIQQGVSHVVLSADGKFQKISGFFDLPEN